MINNKSNLPPTTNVFQHVSTISTTANGACQHRLHFKSLTSNTNITLYLLKQYNLSTSTDCCSLVPVEDWISCRDTSQNASFKWDMRQSPACTSSDSCWHGSCWFPQPNLVEPQLPAKPSLIEKALRLHLFLTLIPRGSTENNNTCRLLCCKKHTKTTTQQTSRRCHSPISMYIYMYAHVYLIRMYCIHWKESLSSSSPIVYKFRLPSYVPKVDRDGEIPCVWIALLTFNGLFQLTHTWLISIKFNQSWIPGEVIVYLKLDWTLSAFARYNPQHHKVRVVPCLYLGCHPSWKRWYFLTSSSA